MHRTQVINPPPPDRSHSAQMVAQPALHLAPKRGVVERDHPVRLRRPLGPDDGRQVRLAFDRRHRQLRERTAGQEMLQRHALMRPLMRHRRDDAALIIRKPGDADAGLLTQRRAAALCRHHQPRMDRRPTHNLHDRTRARPRDHRLGRGVYCKSRLVQCPVQRRPQAARLDHPAERLGPGLRGIEMQMQPRRAPPDPAVRHADVPDRPDRERQPIPHARSLQQPSRPGRHGIGATVEIRMLHGRQRGPVHNGHANPARRQPARQRTPDRPGADDADIDAHINAGINTGINRCLIYVHVSVSP